MESVSGRSLVCTGTVGARHAVEDRLRRALEHGVRRASAELVGGQFLYTPMKSRGVDRPDSGYIIDVPYTVSPVMDHPITEGIEPFDIVDEAYLSEVFEDSIVPLFTSSWGYTRDNFYSAANAVLKGELNSNEGWEHDDGSNIVGWIKTYKNSPVVYLQFGDGPATYENVTFRRILAQAIKWASSAEAKEWAQEHNKKLAAAE